MTHSFVLCYISVFIKNVRPVIKAANYSAEETRQSLFSPRASVEAVIDSVSFHYASSVRVYWKKSLHVMAEDLLSRCLSP